MGLEDNMKKITTFLAALILLFAVPAVCEASWLWSPDLGKWINPKKTAKDTPDQQYEWAMEFYKQQNWDRAIEEFSKIPDVFPNSRLAAEGVFFQGLSYEKKNDIAKAADAFQKLVDRYPYSDRIKDAVAREFEIAGMFARGEKIKVAGIPTFSGRDRAIELYQHIVKNAPFGTFGDQAQFQIGEVHKNVGDYEEAQKAYRAVVDEYPSSDLVPKARYQIAYVAMLSSKRSQENDLYTQKAIEEFKSFKEAYPENAQVLEADESIKTLRSKKAMTLFETGTFYDKQNKLTSAKVYYHEAITGFPETSAAELAQKRLEQLSKQNDQPQQPKKFLGLW